ncbi:minor tail protein [Gordonia phage Bjanes7]|uniref:Minor tail protein n=5 Tax=Attisvirus TaxID=2169652 RepID=A0A142K8R7_9CAUD|nr:minor tail protein [Gordonia phage SoilAssassin]YP_009595783.1 minor tail protein [Gordonia phage Attis]YP_010653598.1 minor tail protein [Gordonia phage Yeet412]YP_010653814.1 minor tail protein [Gordonia phage Bjanes7]QDF18345.1 minor tail protein [Gordonia phage LordFarquaad]AMS02426.1 minor tail protein [Gordonia phage SoilAssassin]AMS02500.1 minor tail protein [Gordonia phage Attis]ATW60722.1 minor tail protein [Gordonia phage Bjanes7]QWY84534.1 minor tail protein [Gordonia phage Ye
MGVRIPGGRKPRVDNDPLEDFWDEMVEALKDVPIRILMGVIGIVPVFGQPLANALGAWLLDTSTTAEQALESADSAQTQIVTIQQVFSVRSNRPFWEGPDPTGESSFPFSLLAKPAAHTHNFTADGSGTRTTTSSGTNRVVATQSLLPMALVKCEYNTEKKQVSFKLRKVGTVTAAYIDVYVMGEDGSFTLLTSTPDVAADFLTVDAWQRVLMPSSYLSEMGDWLGVQFRMVGSGSLSIAGVEMEPENFFPEFRPLNYALMRTTNSAPSVITRAQADEAYSYLVPYVQIGSDVGQVNAPRNFFDNFNRSTLGPAWSLQRQNGGNLEIANNAVRDPSFQLIEGMAAALYTLPLTTDKIAAEWDSLDNRDNDRWSGVVLCASSDFTNFLYVATEANEVMIGTMASLSGGFVERARVSTGTTGSTDGHWLVVYDGPVAQGGTNTYRVYKGSNVVDGEGNITVPPIVTWTDSGNAINHGKGNRFGGLMIHHANFAIGSPIDNWRYYDWTNG